MFPVILRSERKKMGLTQMELATRLNMSQSVIASWESGRTQPDNDSVVKLSKIFGVSTDYLLGVECVKSDTEEDLARVLKEKGLTEKNTKVILDMIEVLEDSDKEFIEISNEDLNK